MVNWKLEVQNFPARIVSRMTPSGTRVSDSVLRLHRYKREFIEGEAPDTVFYSGYHIRLGYDKPTRCFWTVVEAAEESRHIENSVLGQLLQHPDQISGAGIETRKNYLKMVSKGRLDRQLGEEAGAIAVRYSLLKEKQDPDRAFDAFFFVFKPVLKAIHNHLQGST